MRGIFVKIVLQSKKERFSTPLLFFSQEKEKRRGRCKTKKRLCIRYALTALSFPNIAAYRTYPNLVQVGHTALLFPLPLHGTIESCRAVLSCSAQAAAVGVATRCPSCTNPAWQLLRAGRRGIEARLYQSLHQKFSFSLHRARRVSFSLAFKRKRNGGRGRSPLCH